MTPFMVRVGEVAGGGIRPGGPAVAAVVPRTVASALHRQVAARGMAEQLVAEANAVLGPDAFELTDHSALAFTVRHGDRSADITTTIATTIAGSRATASLDGTAVELADADDVAELLLQLLAG